jgi:hypothetical protein
MGTLSRDQILSANDRKTDVVEVPEWGGSVKIRSMSGAQAEEFKKLVDDDDLTEVQTLIKVISMSAVDDTGSQLFTDSDLEALAEKSITVLNHVAAACMKVNGFNQEEVAEDLKETADA